MSGSYVEVDAKNQITIPKSMREKLHIKVGDYLFVDVQGNIMVLLPKPTNYANYIPELPSEIWKSIHLEKYLNDERDAW